MTHNLEIEFVVNHGQDNDSTCLSLTEDKYDNIKQDLEKAKKRRGRPVKKGSKPHEEIQEKHAVVMARQFNA